jgi:DNA-binding transcriptional regulator YiaG
MSSAFLKNWPHKIIQRNLKSKTECAFQTEKSKKSIINKSAKFGNNNLNKINSETELNQDMFSHKLHIKAKTI